MSFNKKSTFLFIFILFIFFIKLDFIYSSTNKAKVSGSNIIKIININNKKIPLISNQKYINNKDQKISYTISYIYKKNTPSRDKLERKIKTIFKKLSVNEYYLFKNAPFISLKSNNETLKKVLIHIDKLLDIIYIQVNPSKELFNKK
ncbi:MAG: hypothetical protein SVN78_00435 [Deferribacterota bacterium]|nr:hypothetical protein [Deferribacterota bacterium]